MKEVHDRERKREKEEWNRSLRDSTSRSREIFFEGEENFKLSSFFSSFNGVSFARGELTEVVREKEK